MTSPYDSVRYRSLENRSVLITGGASGIGSALVQAFVQQGSRVSFLDIDATAGTSVAQRTGARFIACDLLDIGALREAVREVEAAQEGIDVLINNAGKDDRQEFASIEPADWRRLLGLNLDHQFFASQAVAAGMAGYTTAKGAINGLTRTLARELGPTGVRVNCIVPGAILTERQRKLWRTPALDAEFIELQSLKFPVTVEHVAKVALFLASDESAGCTGANFIVDGGLTQN
jgi:NAD(P)-dependent dehydrogenase (short-subunit alcohol dehydrogenase family)